MKEGMKPEYPEKKKKKKKNPDDELQKMNTLENSSPNRDSHPHSGNRLAGLVVKASASGAEDPGFESRL